MASQLESVPLIPRYGRTQRVLHWWIAATFGLTVLTAPEGGRGHGPALATHILSASALVLGALIVVVLGDRTALGSDLRALIRLDPADRAWLRALPRYRPGQQSPNWGKFNTGQKLAAWTLLLLICGVLTTGAFDAISGRQTVHPVVLALTFLVLAGHVFMAVVNPITRPALRGMVMGSVNRTWASRHHSAWVEEVDRQRPSE